MVLLNISLVLMFMTALLQKIVSAPHTPDQPSTSSEPIALDDPPKGPPIYYNFLEGKYILQPKHKIIQI